MMKSVVPVVFATDKNYAPYCSVAIASLIEHRDPEREYEIFVFCDDLGEHQEKLENMSLGGVTVRCINVSGYIQKERLYAHGHITIATYYRLVAQDVLPQFDKILYLDCDIVIFRDVGELYDRELGENLLAAVVDPGMLFEEFLPQKDYLEKMGLRPEKYFNAGILVMNLKQFRKENIGQKCMEYLDRNRNLKWMDQDTLNVICKDRIIYLPEIWNMGQYAYNRDYFDGRDMQDVCILHYSSANKPWNGACWTSDVFFYQAAANTPYKDALNRMLLKNNTAFHVRAIQKADEGDFELGLILKILKLWILRKWESLTKKK